MNKIRDFLVQKEDGAEGVVVAVVLIVVAIGISVLFKDQIGSTIGTSMDEVDLNIASLF